MMRTFPIPAMFERRGSGIWTPARLGQQFSNFAWLEPNPITAMFQDAAGTTPVTATGQVVGLLLDQSKGLALGPELVTNGGPFTDTTGWLCQSGTLSIVNKNILVVDGGLNTSAYCAVPTVAGKMHKCTVMLSGTISSNIHLGLGSSAPSAGNYVVGGTDNVAGAAIGPHTFYQVATGSTSYICIGGESTPPYEIASVSVREVLGGIASQSTTANKPTYQLSPQGAPVLQHDTTDVLTLTAASSLGATASVYYSNATGVQQTHNVNVGSSYNLPGAPGAGTDDVYGWIITPTRPDQVTENRIIKYLSKKANV